MSADHVESTAPEHESAQNAAVSSAPRSDAKKIRKLCSLVRFHADELMRGTTKLSLSVDALHLILSLVAGDGSSLVDGSDPLLFEAACLKDVLKSVLKLKVPHSLL